MWKQAILTLFAIHAQMDIILIQVATIIMSFKVAVAQYHYLKEFNQFRLFHMLNQSLEDY